jgi:hypothetical protein
VRPVGAHATKLTTRIYKGEERHGGRVDAGAAVAVGPRLTAAAIAMQLAATRPRLAQSANLLLPQRTITGTAVVPGVSIDDEYTGSMHID